MAIIATDWADSYGGRQENFLMQQMRNLANPDNKSVGCGAPHEAKTDPATGHLVGMDMHYVTSDRVGDRLRFHLHRGANPLPLPALPMKTLPWGWADEFANKPQNFLTDMVRRLHYSGTGNDLGIFENYSVVLTKVDGRVRYDLRPAEVVAAKQPNIFD